MKTAPVRVFSSKHPLSRILPKGAGMVRSANKSATKREHEPNKEIPTLRVSLPRNVKPEEENCQNLSEKDKDMKSPVNKAVRRPKLK